MTASITNLKTNCILFNYPLSQGFSERLAALIGPNCLKLSLTELRSRPLPQMWCYLRSLKIDRFYLAMEDENGTVILPMQKMIASIARARAYCVVDAQLRITSFSRLEAFSSAFQYLYASFAVLFATRKAKREIAILIQQERRPQVAPSNKVLYLNANLWFGLKAGGSVGHISGVANALSQLDYPVHFASANGRLLVDTTCSYSPLKPPPIFGSPWELNFYRFHFYVTAQMKQLAKSEPFGLIYQRFSLINYSGVVLSRTLGVPLILEYNGSEAWVSSNWGHGLREESLAVQIEEVNLKHAHLIVTVSEALRDELISRNVDPERIVTYPNCIDVRMFDPTLFSKEQTANLRMRYKISQDALVVTFIGTFGSWHGIEVLARAVRKLIDEELEWLKASKLHFLLVGDGIKMAEVCNILAADANGPFASLTGLVPQNEAPLYLAASDILTSPHVPNSDGTRFFNSPIKLFEYMAMGKAILASDLGQVSDVLAGSLDAAALPEVNSEPNQKAPGVLCQPGNPDEIIQCLKFLVQSPKWRIALGENARDLALSKYTWKHHVQAILSTANQHQLLATPPDRAS